MTRTYTPKPARVPSYVQESRTRWCVTGTAYGYLHTTAGDIRTWATYSGAYKACRRYVAL